MKKLVALLLVLCMVLSLGTVALAEEKALAGKTVILHSNDVHGAVEGYAKMAALKAQYEADGAEVILVDAGDFCQGGPYVSFSKGANAIEMMNAAGYDIVTLGNHDFDYGTSRLLENMENAAFKVICANVFGADGKNLFDANTVYTTKSGVKIGFFGLDTPEAQTKANPVLIKGVKILAGDDLFKCAQEQIDELKASSDIVICLSHLGMESESTGNRSFDLYEKISGQDFIIDAHSHVVMTEGPEGQLIQSAGTGFSNIGVIVIDDATKKIEDHYLVEVAAREDEAELADSFGVKYEKRYVLDEAVTDETVAAAAKKIVDAVDAELGAKFATSKVTLTGDKSANRSRESNSGDLIADAIRWYILKDKGALTVDEDKVVAILNGGAVRAEIKAGDVTKKDANTVLPFGNTVTAVYVTGAKLLEALEASSFCTPENVGGFPQVSGMKIKIDTSKPYDAGEMYPASTYHAPRSINRVTIDEINGKPFDPEETYAVVVSNFCSDGGDTFYAFGAAENKFDTGTTMDEALIEYISTELKGVIGEEYAAPQGRIVMPRFTDVGFSHWAYEYVDKLAEAGIMNGTGNAFEPNTNLSRAMVVTMLYRQAGKPAVAKKASEIFSDCADDAWYADAVVWAYENEIVNGTSKTTFAPDSSITRQDLAKILYGYARKEGKGFTGSWMFLLSNPDANLVADYANEAMHWVVMKGILTGKGAELKLDPKGLATRAEAAKMLSVFMDVLAEK